MKTLTVQEIINRVRTKIDEIAVNESEMEEADSDNLNLNTIIKSCIADAYRYVSLNADISLLEGKVVESPVMVIGDDMVARITLPSDFLRLVNVRLKSWISAPSVIIDEYSAEYRMQSNKWLCGTPARPVAALVRVKEGRQVELYKASSKDDSVKVLAYIPSLESDMSSVELPVQVIDAFIHYVAALTLVTLREESSADHFKIAQNLLGIG